MKFVRIAVDYGVVIAWIGTWIVTRNMELATWVLVGAAVVALLVGWLVEKRLAPLPLLAGAAALVFGSLTLIFHDSRFVKMKLTFVDSALAVALLSGVFLKRNPLKSMLGDAIVLDDAAWRVLTIRYAAFFALCAGANEIVWRTQGDDTYKIFRLGVLGAAVVFSLLQTPFLMKHGAKDEAPEPPDAGF